MRTDPSDRLRAELAVLRDGVIRAIREDNLADLGQGFDLYSELITSVYRRVRQYEDATGASGAGLLSRYGPEMSWLEDDIRTFISLAIGRGDVMVRRELLSFLFDLPKSALIEDEPHGFGAAIDFIGVAWYHAAADGNVHSTAIRSSLLEHLRTLGSYVVGPAVARSESDPWYALRLVAELAQRAREAISSQAADELHLTLEVLDDVMRFALDPDRLSPSSPAHEAAVLLRGFKSAALLSLLAWFEHRRQRTEFQPGVEEAMRSALNSTSTRLTWEGFLAARQQSTQDLLRWSSWETGEWGGRRSGALGFHIEVDRAFVEQLVADTVELPKHIRTDEELDPHLYSHLRGLLDAVASVGARSATAKRRKELASQLTSLEEEATEQEELELVEMPLLPDKVASFRQAAESAWLRGRQLRSLVTEAELGESEPAAGSQDPLGFGMNHLVPKDYFVDQPGVHADSADLGREFGGGLARGEDELVVAELLTMGSPHDEVSVRDLPQAVERAVADLLEDHSGVVVLVLNSFDGLLALRTIATDGGSMAADLASDAPRVVGTEVPILYRHIGADDFCVVADLEAAITLQNGITRPSLDGDQLSADGRLLTGVRRLDRAAAESIARGRIKSRRPSDDELRKLMVQVQARVFERLRVVGQPGVPVRVIRIACPSSVASGMTSEDELNT